MLLRFFKKAVISLKKSGDKQQADGAQAESSCVSMATRNKQNMKYINLVMETAPNRKIPKHTTFLVYLETDSSYCF